MFGSGDGVDTPFVPRMAAAYALDPHPAATQDTMTLDSLFGITGAGGMKTALPAHDGTKDKAIGLDQIYQEGTHFFAIFCQQLSISSRSS